MYICQGTILTLSKLVAHILSYLLPTGQRSDKGYTEFYKWACYVWIIVGMSFLALIISLLSDLMTDYAGKLREEQKQRLKQLKNLTGKQLTRLGSSDKKGIKGVEAGYHGDEDRVEEEDRDGNVEETPLDAGEKVTGDKKELNGKDHVKMPDSLDKDGNGIAPAEV